MIIKERSDKYYDLKTNKWENRKPTPESVNSNLKKNNVEKQTNKSLKGPAATPW